MMPQPTDRISAAARQIADARLQRRRFGGLDEWCRPRDEDEAYAVQQDLHRLLSDAGHGCITGRKIGCTTPVMQKYLGIPNPCAGAIFDSTVARERGLYSAGDFLTIGVECEIAIRLVTDLIPDANGHVSRAAAAAAIGTCMAAIEVVEDRYVSYPVLDTPTLIADDFFNAGCVLGKESDGFPPERLDTVTGLMEINGEEVGRGRGTDVLGHPLEPLRWLAAASAQWHDPLRAGEFVLLGSLVQTNWLQPGDVVRIVNDPLGEVTMRLT